MPKPNTRKRPAPGSSTPVQQTTNPASLTGADSLRSIADDSAAWAQPLPAPGKPSFSSPSGTSSTDMYTGMGPTAMQQQSPSNQLARRSANAMMSRRPYSSAGNDLWPASVDAVPQNQQDMGWNQSTEEESLDQEAQEAMDAAKKSRKSIPPFVQKLRGFLDDSRNIDLIRWSDNGESFFVLDEEEFARTLIPEMFKHANYASFVRQLNMYGFHKKVGLSDNSMRASERKNKSPSEYANPYFTRGRPNLVWLIQKPKTQKKGGKRPEEDDEDEGFTIATPGQGQPLEEKPANGRQPRQPLLIGEGDKSLAQDDFAELQRELRQMRQQHRMVSEVIQKIRREHDQLYQQAAAFQELHERHENSINAILTFLATVYNRSLEGHNNPGIASMFAGTLPHDIPQQGSVVDVGDFPSSAANTPNGLIRRPSRRQPLLLKAPPMGGTSTGASSAATTPGQQPDGMRQGFPAHTQRQQRQASQQPQGVVEEIPDQDQNSNIQFSSAANTPQTTADHDIMSFINSQNAQGANSFINKMDFPQALSHLQTADGKSPLSTNERNNALQLMASNSGSRTSTDRPNSNNALTSPTPPTMPINMETWDNTTHDLAFLTKTMKEQDERMDTISSMLQPLSPSGSIPGLQDSSHYANAAHPNESLDFDQIFNSGDYFNDNGEAGGLDFGNNNPNFGANDDFGFDGVGRDSAHSITDFADTPQPTSGGRVVETVNSSEATSPANTVQTNEDEAHNGEEPISPRKRQRRR